jgi:hypothetical protein
LFANFFGNGNFQIKKIKFPIKKYPCVIRAVELEVDNDAVGDMIELHAGSEIVWRSEISSPGIMRVEHLAYISKGPMRMVGNLKRVDAVEIVKSEIYSKNFQVLVEEERRRLSMTTSAALRLSEISENSRLQTQIAKIRTFVKTGKFEEARKFLSDLRDRKFETQEITDLQKEVDHHFFMMRKVPRTNFRSTRPAKSDAVETKVVFGRTMRIEYQNKPEISPRRAQSPSPPPPEPETPSAVRTEKSSKKFPIRTRLCLEWLRTGECAREERCPYAHETDTEISSAILVEIYRKLFNSITS